MATLLLEGAVVSDGILGPRGNYRSLKAFVMAGVVYDGTVAFVGRVHGGRGRQAEQMVQAARSGRQNIAEGSLAAATSRKSEILLTNVARASLEELLLDYEDFLRQRGLELWGPEHPKAVWIRKLRPDAKAPYEIYRRYIEELSLEDSANCLLCLIHQTNYLLDRLLRTMERRLAHEGGFSERASRVRRELRRALEDGEGGGHRSDGEG